MLHFQAEILNDGKIGSRGHEPRHMVQNFLQCLYASLTFIIKGGLPLPFWELWKLFYPGLDSEDQHPGLILCLIEVHFIPSAKELSRRVLRNQPFRGG